MMLFIAPFPCLDTYSKDEILERYIVNLCLIRKLTDDFVYFLQQSAPNIITLSNEDLVCPSGSLNVNLISWI